MRIIDADKYRKDLLSTYDDCSMELEVLDRQPLVQAIPIPEGTTNGDMIKAMFPDVEIDIVNNTVLTDIDTGSWFSLDWWNAPYKKGEVKE